MCAHVRLSQEHKETLVACCFYLQLRFGDFPALVHVQSRERVPDRLQQLVPQRHDGGFNKSTSSSCPPRLFLSGSPLEMCVCVCVCVYVCLLSPPPLK